MSRGHGAVQRFVLGYLDRVEYEDDPWPSPTPVDRLAAKFSGSDTPPRSVVESVRRACKRLAAEGHVEVVYVSEKRLHRLRADRVPWWWRRNERYGRLVDAGATSNGSATSA